MIEHNGKKYDVAVTNCISVFGEPQEKPHILVILNPQGEGKPFSGAGPTVESALVSARANINKWHKHQSWDM